eukprot:TRINITY_DN2638_c0_g2_i1.p1 TRINITY_DN2638_c0_g2~~TRINITY_DN2638_c0_g2_i1.p1  ORF type:complete len:511 (+),score=61.24 TRINITY_DN2638_c0_g2_i1:16-1548(+)
MDKFIDLFPFLKDKIQKDPKYWLTKEDLEMITEEVSLNDLIQHFEIPESTREGVYYDLDLIPMFSRVLNALKLNTSITTLDLSNWNFSELSTEMAEVIMLNNTITDLNLSSHKFRREMMNAIRMSSTIQTLDLYSCDCDEGIFENTRGTNPNLTSLDIRENEFNFTHVAEWLKDNFNLTSLTLSGSQITASARNIFCEWFSKRSTITDLNMIYMYGDIDGIGTCIRNHGKLQKFMFVGALCQSGAKGALALLESLCFNKDIHYLNISSSFYDQAFSAPIGQVIDSLPLLTELNLQGNKLDHNISDALRRNTTLTSLNLHSCLTGDDIVKVCEALHNHPTLTWLSFANQFKFGSKKEISAISELLQTRIPLKTLYSDGRSDNSDGIEDLAQALKNNQTLTLLSFSGIGCKNKGAIAFAECLAVNNTLTKLNLARNSIENDGIIAIAKSLEKNTSLQTLNISNNSINNEGVEPICQMFEFNTTLTTLMMFECITVKGKEKELQTKYGQRIVI